MPRARDDDDFNAALAGLHIFNYNLMKSILRPVFMLNKTCRHAHCSCLGVFFSLFLLIHARGMASYVLFMHNAYFYERAIIFAEREKTNDN